MPPAGRTPLAASCTSAGCSVAAPCRTSGSSRVAASLVRACRRSPSTARRSASTTHRSEPGARPGWIRSTAACAASSGAPPGGEILLISDEDDPQLRWRFTDIRPDSFTWRGEVSRDGGATWAQDEEMRITRRAATADALVEALHAPGPAGPYAEELRLFDRFAGSWDTAWSGRDADGRARSARGEAHFGWVLGGRAMQDLWILPRRGERGEAGAPAFHGTWIRFFDPSIGAWRGTWMDPVNGDVLRFVVRPAGDEILMLADAEEPRLRWRFTEIEADSFSFRAESSADGGATWVARRGDASHARLGLYRISGTSLYALGGTMPMHGAQSVHLGPAARRPVEDHRDGGVRPPGRDDAEGADQRRAVRPPRHRQDDVREPARAGAVQGAR